MFKICHWKLGEKNHILTLITRNRQSKQNIVCFNHGRITRDVTHSREERCGDTARLFSQACHTLWIIKCGKWRSLKLPNAKSVFKTIQKNTAAQILLPTYYFVEHFFASHIQGFTVMEHGAYYDGNPTTQSISEILCHQKSYSLILHFFDKISDYYFF